MLLTAYSSSLPINTPTFALSFLLQAQGPVKSLLVKLLSFRWLWLSSFCPKPCSFTPVLLPLLALVPCALNFCISVISNLLPKAAGTSFYLFLRLWTLFLVKTILQIMYSLVFFLEMNGLEKTVWKIEVQYKQYVWQNHNQKLLGETVGLQALARKCFPPIDKLKYIFLVHVCSSLIPSLPICRENVPCNQPVINLWLQTTDTSLQTTTLGNCCFKPLNYSIFVQVRHILVLCR